MKQFQTDNLSASVATKYNLVLGTGQRCHVTGNVAVGLAEALSIAKTISVEQSSCCSTQTGDDSAHIQETTDNLFHLWCAGEQKGHSPPPDAVVAFSWFCRLLHDRKVPEQLTACLQRELLKQQLVARNIYCHLKQINWQLISCRVMAPYKLS